MIGVALNGRSHLLAAIILFPLVAGADLLQNGGFGDSAAYWEISGPAITFGAEKIEGDGTLLLDVSEDDPLAYHHYRQNFEAAPGDILELAVVARGENIREGNGVYAALNFFGADNERISFEQTSPATPDGTWQEINLLCIAPPGTVKAHCALLLHGRGRANFKNAALFKVGRVDDTPITETVELNLADNPLPQKLIGFGAEDDGWFFNEANAPTVDEEAIALYQKRLAWMRPDWARMFFWYPDFNPSGDWVSFDWESDNMRSHYKALETYQALGAAVNVTGVEWDMNEPFGDMPALARAVGELLEHLINRKGFTCIKYWTLTNEPNTHFIRRGGTFGAYVEAHRLVKEEITRRGLDVKIVGSDDTNGGLAWFKSCIETPEYMGAVDIFASHRYFKTHEVPLAPYFFSERLNLLKGEKPFAVAEFGFQDAKSGTLENPVMETYQYAVWTAAFAIQGLNQGVSGFNIWCLHEVLYPKGWRMTYGLWNYGDRMWGVRPAYHAWAMFSRLCDAGDSVTPITSSRQKIYAAKVNGIVFFCNASESDVGAHFTGETLYQARIYTEETLHGDEECGNERPIIGNKLTIPAMSFGYFE